jgi:ADP-heptose:LPS heptosyltransferase
MGVAAQVRMISVRRLQARLAIVIEAAANTALGAARRMLWAGARPSSPARVAVYRIGNIGDTACAVPALAAIRQALGAAHITLITSPGARGLPGASELLAGAEFIDEIVTYYADEVTTIRGRIAFIRAMRARQFDLWIELPVVAATFVTLIRNMIAARLAGARHGLGWRHDGLRLFARAQSEQIKFSTESARLLAMLAAAHLAPAAAPAPSPQLAIGVAECAAAARVLAARGLGTRPLVILAPGAKAAPNRWPAERFAAVGADLAARGYALAILGGADDAVLAEDVARTIGSDAASFAGRTTILESCAMLARAALLICNDSGVQHLATLVGTPSVSLFSCRDFRGKWFPSGEHQVVLRKEVDCHTCFLERCPRGNLCINLIEPREVIASALALSPAPGADADRRAV